MPMAEQEEDWTNALQKRLDRVAEKHELEVQMAR